MLLELVLFFLALFLLFYRYVTKQFGHWESLGIPNIEGKFPFGSNSDIFLGKSHLNDDNLVNYEKFRDEDIFGTYLFGKPVLNVNNVESIRHILVKDFSSFVDRNDVNLNKIFDGGSLDQVWKKQMTAITGDEWKDVRTTFTPIFTSGKMRGMLKFIVEVGVRLKQEFGKLSSSGEDFDLKDVFGKFSLDSLATCAFGIDPQSFDDNDSRFVKSAAKIFTQTAWDKLIAIRLIPGVQYLTKLLGMNMLNPKETKFFKDILTDMIKKRRESGIRQNDLIDLMIDCIKDDVERDDNENELDQFHKDMTFQHEKTGKVTMDEDTVVATALVLLVAGYDTTGMTLSFLAYNLAKNPDIQSKLQEEVDQAFQDNNGKMPDYTVIQELPYIEMCILEALRLHTPVGGLNRCCTKDTTIPNYPHPIRKNDLINIPVIGIHMDERYYPNPEQFNPENFSKEARQARSPYTFIGFGQGPRGCIGMRFAMLEAKVAMMEVLSSYTFLPSDKNPQVLKIDPNSQLGYIKGGLHAKIVKRSET